MLSQDEGHKDLMRARGIRNNQRKCQCTTLQRSSPFCKHFPEGKSNSILVHVFPVNLCHIKTLNGSQKTEIIQPGFHYRELRHQFIIPFKAQSRLFFTVKTKHKQTKKPSAFSNRQRDLCFYHKKLIFIFVETSNQIPSKGNPYIICFLYLLCSHAWLFTVQGISQAYNKQISDSLRVFFSEIMHCRLTGDKLFWGFLHFSEYASSLSHCL